jgi:hypothetical protein
LLCSSKARLGLTEALAWCEQVFALLRLAVSTPGSLSQQTLPDGIASTVPFDGVLLDGGVFKWRDKMLDVEAMCQRDGGKVSQANGQSCCQVCRERNARCQYVYAQER